MVHVPQAKPQQQQHHEQTGTPPELQEIIAIYKNNPLFETL